MKRLAEKLSQLERVWHQREITQPEKAHKMLALIDSARVVFNSQQSKEEYDRSLECPNQSDDTTSNKEIVEQWKAAANDYFSNGQYDLAETALEKAFMYPEAMDDEALLILAGNVYHNDGKYDRAINYLNNALLLNSDNWQSYALKGIAYVDIGRFKQQGIYHGAFTVDENQMFRDAANIYDLGIAAARKCANTFGEGFIQGHKAFLLYNTQGQEAASEALSEAMRLGDPSGQGKVISDAIDQKRQREYHFSIDYYPCAPIEKEEPMNGLFYTRHTLVLDEVESALIYAFLGQEVKMTYDSYNLRHQFGGHEIEDRETCWYEWTIPNEGKVRFDLLEKAPESFNDGGYTKLTMTYDGSNAGFPMIKEKLDQAISRIKGKGIEVMQASQIQQLKESRIVQYRRSIGRCLYCGGQFKGLITKKCDKCGRVKNY